MTAKHIETGSLGEDIAVRHLKSQGYTIVKRNYRVGYGEIDIIATSEVTTHFVEVKTVTRETDVSVTQRYRPEDNMHPQKIKILLRTIERYLMESARDYEWQLDLITVELHVKHKNAVIRHIKNIIQ
jgi:putative endonuclease